MSGSEQLSSVRRKARKLVCIVSAVIVVQIFFSLLYQLDSLGVIEKNRERDLVAAFGGIIAASFANLETMVHGYSEWTDVAEQLRDSGSIETGLGKDWLQGNGDKNDFVAILHRRHVVIDGGREADALREITNEPWFMVLYSRASMTPQFETNHFIVHHRGRTLLLVLAANSDNSSVPLAEGVQVFANVLDKSLATAGSLLNALISFDPVLSSAELVRIPLADSMNPEAVRWLNIIPSLPLRSLVLRPMLVSLSIQILMMAGVIAVFLVFLRTIGRLFREVDSLNNKLKNQNDRLEREMRLAGHLQGGLVPPAGKYRGTVEIGRTTSSDGALRPVGGDVHDIVVTNDAEWLIMLDLAGRDVPATLLTTFAVVAFREEVLLADSPVGLFKNLVPKLEPYLPDGARLSALAARISGDAVDFCSAGGEDGYFFRKRDNKIYALNSSGPALGGSNTGEWKSYHFAIEEGDRLVFFSGTVIGLPVGDGRPLGRDAVLDMFKTHLAATPQDLVESVLADIAKVARVDVDRADLGLFCLGKMLV